MTRDPALFEYLLRLADSDLVLAQRLGEWVGKGPVLEEDIALTNVGLDLIGQARLWFAYAGEVEGRYAGAVRSEDQLAFLRDGAAYRNLQLVEQPNGNYADTMARQFYYDQWHLRVLHALTTSRDARIAEIAAKAVKEVAYHVERSTRLDRAPGRRHRRFARAHAGGARRPVAVHRRDVRDRRRRATVDRRRHRSGFARAAGAVARRRGRRVSRKRR